ncbi:MAG: SH3 domain-containing protein [Thermomicrobiales bacterium]
MLTSSTFNRRAFLARSGTVAGAAAIAAAGFSPFVQHAGAQDFEAAAVFEYNDSVMVNTDALNLRSEPGLSASILGTYPYGSTFVVVDGPTTVDNYRWYKVLTDDANQAGWFAGVYLSLASTPVQPVVTVIDGPVNMRDDAGLSANIIGVYPTGATGISLGLAVLGEVDGHDWYLVRMDNDDQTGCIAADFISVS